jgi:PAS domain S-box-containing protein
MNITSQQIVKTDIFQYTLIVSTIIVVAGTFAFDILMPLGVAAGVPYVIAILITSGLHNTRTTIITAILCSLLVFAGFYLSSTGGEVWKVMTNRLLALMAIWITAWFSLINERGRLYTQSILDNAVDGIITTNEQSIVETINPAVEKLFGYKPAELIGENIKMLMPEPYCSEHDQYMDNYRRTGEKKIIGIGREVRGKHQDGSTFPLDLAISESRSDKGRIFVGIVRDITERKEAEEKISNLLDSIVTRVAQFVDLISKITKGDLSQQIVVEGDDDLSQLAVHLNAMTDALTGITNRIREASSSSLSSLKELEAAIQSQTTGASEQASSVNETSTTLQEIKSISVQTIEKASALGDSAERTREEGSRGLVAIKQTAQSMQDIRTKVEDIAETILGLSEQTQQIGEITALVNKVAEQSKLLALNASIEAAKAGEAGVGFSVVATEVKDLAEQSGQATQQVQKILQDIQRATDKAVMTTEEGSKEVDRGIEMTRQAGEIMQNLSDVITETSTASEQIVAAVRQEGTGIDQIVAAMNDINKVTSQFVAATQQTQSGVDNLVSINSQLDKSVSVYKLAS